MSHSHAVSKQMHTATGVKLCASAHMLAPAAERRLPELVVVRENVLTIFSVTGQRLRERLSVTLSGVPETLAVLPRAPLAPRTQRDSLLLSFSAAKLSVVDYDPGTNELHTSSLHSWEGVVPPSRDAALACSHPTRPPLVVADPEGRCAAAIVGSGSELALMRTVEAGFGAAADGGRTLGPQDAAALEPSYRVPLKALNIHAVRDACFLHGYAEPVLLILHETSPTWAARATIRKDTCALTALSLNLRARRHPTIWNFGGLPFDSYRLSAVPAPIGGALVFSSNYVLFRSQAGAFSLAVNDLALGGPQDACRDGPGGEATAEGRVCNPPPQVASGAVRSQLTLDLESCRCAWLAPSTALLSLKTGTLMLLRLTADARGAVGSLELSRAGDSVVATSLAILGTSLVFLGSRLGDSLLVRFNERRSGAGQNARGEDGEPAAKRARGETEEEDELLIYSEAGAPTTAPAPAPAPTSSAGAGYGFVVRDSLPGIGPVADVAIREVPAPAGLTAAPKRTEIVSTAGTGRSGAFVVLNRGVCPEFLFELALRPVTGMWALHYKRPHVANAEGYHAYLMLSVRGATMVLEEGEQLQELTAQGAEFLLDRPTLEAGTLFGQARLAQVHADGVRLMAGTVRAQDVSLRTAVGGEGVTDGVKVVAAEVLDPYVLLRLSDGRAVILSGEPATNRLAPMAAASAALAGLRPTAACLFHDEGGLLGRGKHAVLCALCTDTRGLEILALPDCSRILVAPAFAEGPRVLTPDQPASAPVGSESSVIAPAVLELRVETFPESGIGEPMVLAIRADGVLLAYRGFTFAKQIRFARLAMDLILPAAEGGVSPSKFVRSGSVRAERPVSGILVTGPRPYWLIPARGVLRAHSLRVGGAATAFTPYHNRHCEHGFLVANDNALLFCQLPKQTSYLHEWPQRRVSVRCTPVAVVYESEMRVYVAAVSKQEPFRERNVHEDDLHMQTIATLSRAAAARHGGMEEVHELRILTPSTFETVWSLALDPGEVVLAMKCVVLRNVSTNRLQTLVAVGTAFPGGEDAPCRGRCLLLQVGLEKLDDVTVWKGEVLVARQYRAAVSAVSVMEEHLLVATGTKIYMEVWNGREMSQGAADAEHMKKAFFDTPLYTTSLNVVKSYVICGDVQNGVRFLHWRHTAHDNLLEQLGKDFTPMRVSVAEFMVDKATLNIVVFDTVGNAWIFAYAPDSRESWQGQLLAKSVTNLGTPVCRAFPQRLADKSQRLGLVYTTADGSLGWIAPIDEESFARLCALQKELVLACPHPAGLNPAAFRAVQTERGRAKRVEPPFPILDGHLLSRFALLPWDAQRTAAARANSTPHQLMADLAHLAAASDFLG
mmetsp:Transcript_20113/g.65502  ORF Transcript_20113/g.65502 Transcript_20113/m.65502 type:complete len:1349 (-) Transcript_20113:519-4565(-)